MNENTTELERPKTVSGAFILDKEERILLVKTYK